jgi:hypothetical protein
MSALYALFLLETWAKGTRAGAENQKNPKQQKPRQTKWGFSVIEIRKQQ